MTAMATSEWIESDQRYLSAELTRIRAALQGHADQIQSGMPATPSSQLEPSKHGMFPGNSALETICNVFALSGFGRSILLLCAGIGLDATLAELCGRSNGNPRCSYPTFALALAMFPNAHWSALTPAAPLRYWRLVDCAHDQPLTTSPLRVDERVLHALTGLSYLDERLQGLLSLHQ